MKEYDVLVELNKRGVDIERLYIYYLAEKEGLMNVISPDSLSTVVDSIYQVHGLYGIPVQELVIDLVDCCNQGKLVPLTPEGLFKLNLEGSRA